MTSHASSSDREQVNQFLAGATKKIEGKDFNGALQLLNKAVLKAPDSILGECYGLRGFVHLKLNDFGRAEDDCTAALREQPDNDEVLIWRAYAFFGQSKWRRAISDVQKAQEINPAITSTAKSLMENIAGSAIRSISNTARNDDMLSSDYLDRANAYRAVGDLRRSLRDAHLAAELHKDNADALLLQAELLVDMGRPQEATEVCSRLIKSDSVNWLPALRLRAKANLMTDRAEKALEDLDRVRRRQPNNAEVIRELGIIRMELRDLQGAIIDFRKVLAINPEDSQVRLKRGEAHALLRHHSAAISDFNELLDSDPSNVSALIARGNVFLQIRAGESALLDFQKVLEMDETNVPANVGQAQSLIAMKKIDRAHTACERAIRLDPRNFAALNVLGGILYDKKEFEKAVEIFTRVIELEPPGDIEADAFYRRGTTRIDLGEMNSAIEDLNQALTIRPRHAGSRVWRAVASAKIGNWKDAIKDLGLAIEFNPQAAEKYDVLKNHLATGAMDYMKKEKTIDWKHPINLANRGQIHLLLKKYPVAIADLSESLKTEPNSVDALMYRAQAHRSSGDLKSALKDYDKAVELSRDVRTLTNRATCRFENEDRRGAIRDLTRAIELQPNNERLFMERGRIWVARGKSREAIHDFDRSIAINSDNFDAYRERGLLRLILSKPQKAISDLTISLELMPKQPELIAKRGEAYLKLRNWQAAREDFELAVTNDPLLVRAHCGRALAMIRMDEHEQALIWLTKAIHRFSNVEDWVEILSTRARVFNLMSRFEMAVTDYTTIIKLLDSDRRSAPSFLARGIAFYHLEKEKRSRKDIETSLSHNSDQAVAVELLKWLNEKTESVPVELEKPDEIVRPKRPKITGRSVTANEIEFNAWETQPPFDLWIVKKGSKEYGPVPKHVLNDWVIQGRMDRQTRLLRADWDRWKRVEIVFPAIVPANSGPRVANESEKDTKDEDQGFDDRPLDDSDQRVFSDSDASASSDESPTIQI